jgi:DHA2 family methylenomycin A resistance protein-like MFS transporter
MTTYAIAPARDRQYGLYAICFGFFLVLLDASALNVATASMAREFGTAMSGLQWIVNAYTIVFASLVLTCGAIGDRYGSKRLYQTGLSVFTLMSLACALSPNVSVLVVMRMLQGLGAAMMLPASLALLSHAFPDPRARARAVSFWASIVSLGFAAGPALGGVFTHYFGWRSIFLLNVPTGIVAILMVRAFIEETNVARARRIDWVGQLSVSLALWALTYALIEAGNVGWTAPRVLAGFAASIILAMAFAFTERRTAAPVLPRALFSRPAFAVCVAIGMFLSLNIYGTLFIESLYLQNVRHLTALATGVMILPFTVLPTVTTRTIDRYRANMHFKPRLITGHVLGLSGAAFMALSVWIPVTGIILVGLGLLGVAVGYITPAMTTGVLTSSPAETAGLASGIMNAGRQVGGSIGVALMGTLVQTHHDRGMTLSLVLTLLLFFLMATIAKRSIPEPHHEAQVTREAA